MLETRTCQKPEHAVPSLTLPLISRETLNKATDVQEASVSQLGKWEHVLGLSDWQGGCLLTLTNWSSLH